MTTQETNILTSRLPAAILVAICIIFAGCSDPPAGLTPEQQVYEVVMNDRLQDALTEVILLSRTEAQYLQDKDNEPVQLRAYIHSQIEVPDELLERLFEANRTNRRLDWQPIMINAKFVDKAQISAETDWRTRQFAKDFYAEFPEHHEFYALSKVAFNDERTEAALVLSYFCPALCGGGEFLIYLEKIGMQWIIKDGMFFRIT